MNGASSIVGLISNVWPVVQRELRARKRRYYWMRVVGGLAGMIVINRMLTFNAAPSELSLEAFVLLDLLILALICIAVPAMTSDCISREKRDGTLGLLFLTPLTPAGIVIGKCITQALMAWSLWLSVLPTLAIPFLLGGLTWQSLVTAAALQFCAVLCSLAAGLLASCWTQKRNAALFCAAVLTCILGSLPLLALSLLAHISRTGGSNIWHGVGYAVRVLCNRDIITSILNGCEVAIDTQLGRMPPAFPLTSMWIITPCLAMAILAVSVWLAARHIRKTWHDQSSSTPKKWWVRRFCTPLTPTFFRSRMRRALDRNPIVWLQQYSWKSRIIKWGLCLMFLLIQLYALSSHHYNAAQLQSLQLPLLLITLAIATVAGVGSFRSEKESGALELILITPLSVNEIILGRVTGWWKQFLPAALTFLLFSFAVQWDLSMRQARFPDTSELFMNFCLLATVYLSLPFFAVYTALRVKYFIPALILAWIGVALEFAFGASLAEFWRLNTGEHGRFLLSLFVLFTFLSSVLFVWLTFFLLRHSLSRRIYSF